MLIHLKIPLNILKIKRRNSKSATPFSTVLVARAKVKAM